jgi:hypothetical protein
MTIKQLVSAALEANYPGKLSNRELANIVQRPEPSVRRATLELEKEGRIVHNYLDASTTLFWQALAQAPGDTTQPTL